MILQPNLVSAFRCTKFQGNQILLLCFTTIFTPWRKKKKRKNEETMPIFECSYLGNALHNLVEILNVRWWRCQAFSAQKLCSFIKVSRSYVYVKIALLFFPLITHRCGAPTSWATLHTTVCLDIWKCFLDFNTAFHDRWTSTISLRCDFWQHVTHLMWSIKPRKKKQTKTIVSPSQLVFSMCCCGHGKNRLVKIARIHGQAQQISWHFLPVVVHP